MPIVRPANRQHTVSQVVLRRFALRGVLTIYDSEQRIFIRKGPRAAFHMPFDRHDAVGSEERWGEIEDQIPQMYSLLKAPSPEEDPRFQSVVRDVLALHWARSAAMKAAHERVTEQVMRRSIENFARYPELLDREMLKSTGLYATSAEALDWFNEEVHRRAVAQNSEEWWSERNALHFAAAKEMMGKWSVQIGYAPMGSELIISDAPVVTVKSRHNGLGPHQGVALGDASEICMPLGPDVMVALGAEPKSVHLTPDVVDRYNDLQVRARVRWLGCRPLGPGEAVLRGMLPVRNPPSPA